MKDEDHFRMTNILEQELLKFENEMPPDVATNLIVDGKPTPSLGNCTPLFISLSPPHIINI